MGKVVGFRIKLSGQDLVIRTANELREAIKRIDSELKGLTFGTPRFEELRRAKSQLLNVNQRLRKEEKEVRNELRESGKDALFAKGSYEQLSAELAVATQRWRKMGKEAREATNGQKIAANIRNIRDELRQINRAGRKEGFFSNIQEQFNFFLRGSVAFAAIDELFNSIRRLGGAIVDVNSQTSDLLAEIQRVAGLSKVEVRELYDQLESLDTRTPTTELLEFAAVGGRLGVAKDQLDGFAVALDRIRIATGGALGDNAEDIAASLGKINNIFNDPQEGDDIGQQLTQIGNAITFLDNQGIASAPFLTDFTNRLAGLRTIANVSLGDTLGLSAGFEELGQTAEVSSTALNGIILQISKDLPAAARLAGLDVNEFSQRFQNDAVGAVLQFSEALVEANRNATTGEVQTESLGQALRAFGVDGRKAVTILGTLGGKTELFERRIREASRALGETGAITDAVSLKQETLAGRTERLKNTFTDLLNSPAVQNFLGTVVDGANEALKAIGNLIEGSKLLRFIRGTGQVLAGLFGGGDDLRDTRQAFADQRAEVELLNTRLPELLHTYNELNKKVTLSSDESKRFGETIKGIGELVPGAVTRYNDLGEAVAFSTDQIVKLTAVQREAADETRGRLLSFLEAETKGIREQIAEQQQIMETSRESLRNGDISAPFADKQQKAIEKANEKIKALNVTLSELQREIRDLNSVSTGGGFFVDAFGRLSANLNNLFPEQQADETKRTVAAIREEIKLLETSLGETTTREEASEIQEKIKVLQRELESIFGKKTGRRAAEEIEVVKGSLKGLREELSGLEDKLGDVTTPRQYLKVFSEIREVQREILEKETDLLGDNTTALKERLNDLNNILESSDSGDEYFRIYKEIERLTSKILETQIAISKTLPTPGRLETGADDIDPIREISSTVFELEIFEDTFSEAEKRALELSDQLAKKTNDNVLQRHRDRLKEQAELEENHLLEQQKILLEFFDGFGVLFGEFLATGFSDAREFVKGFSLLFLDTLKNLALAQVGATAPLAALDPTALVRIGVATLAIEAAFSALKATVQSFEEGGIIVGGGKARIGGSERKPGVGQTKPSSKESSLGLPKIKTSTSTGPAPPLPQSAGADSTKTDTSKISEITRQTERDSNKLIASSTSSTLETDSTNVVDTRSELVSRSAENNTVSTTSSTVRADSTDTTVSIISELAGLVSEKTTNSDSSAISSTEKVEDRPTIGLTVPEGHSDTHAITETEQLFREAIPVQSTDASSELIEVHKDEAVIPVPAEALQTEEGQQIAREFTALRHEKGYRDTNTTNTVEATNNSYHANEGYTGHGSTSQSAGFVRVKAGEAVFVIPSRVYHSPKGQRLMGRVKNLSKSLSASYGHKSTGGSVRGYQEGGIASMSGLLQPSPITEQTVQNSINSASFGGFAQTANLANVTGLADAIKESVKEGSYEGAKEGSMQGAEKGSAKGFTDANRENERRKKLTRRTGF